MHDVHDLQNRADVFGTLFVLANKLQILGDQLDPEVSVKQWLFLAGVTRCDSDAPTLSELAALIGSSRQNVKKMAVLLEARGFLVIRRDESDARALRLVLTDRCKEYFRQREQAETRFLEDLFAGFEPHELTALHRALGKLEANVVRALQRAMEGS